MTFNEYHELIKPSVMPSYPSFGDNLVYPALGCADEAGELAGKIKKLWRDHAITKLSEAHVVVDGERCYTPEVAKLLSGAIKEIGDVLWYLDAMATTLGTTLDQCAQLNVDKLRGRQERGTASGSGDDR